MKLSTVWLNQYPKSTDDLKDRNIIGFSRYSFHEILLRDRD